MSNSLNPDQDRRFIAFDLDQNCLQMLSAEDTSRQKVKGYLKPQYRDKLDDRNLILFLIALTF